MKRGPEENQLQQAIERAAQEVKLLPDAWVMLTILYGLEAQGKVHFYGCEEHLQVCFDGDECKVHARNEIEAQGRDAAELQPEGAPGPERGSR